MMCYLVAKWFDGVGSLAMQAEAGPSLVNMMNRIEGRFGSDDLQLVTITRPSAYGEYAPYTFVSSEDEMIDGLKRHVEA